MLSSLLSLLLLLSTRTKPDLRGLTIRCVRRKHRKAVKLHHHHLYMPVEALKAVARTSPQVKLKMYNACLGAGEFPLAWKTQRLVLISKGKGDPNTPSAYRLLCMLNTTGKLLEKLLKPRLETAIQEAGDLSPRQYGAMKGHSTIQAVQEIVERYDWSTKGVQHPRILNEDDQQLPEEPRTYVHDHRWNQEKTDYGLSGPRICSWPESLEHLIWRNPALETEPGNASGQ